MITIDPRGMGAVEWSDRMTMELEPFASIPELQREEEWRVWAYGAINNQAIAAMQPPDPSHFQDWREWAYRFNQAIYGLNNQ